MLEFPPDLLEVLEQPWNMNVFGKATFKVFVVVLDTVIPCSILLGSGTPGNIAGTTNGIVLSSLEQEPSLELSLELGFFFRTSSGVYLFIGRLLMSTFSLSGFGLLELD